MCDRSIINYVTQTVEDPETLEMVGTNHEI